MEFDFILLFASYYSMISETTGVRQEGITANYLIRTDLNPEIDSSTGAVGYRANKGAIPLSCRDKITQAPAIYHGTFVMKTGGDGRPVLAIQDLEFKSLISVVPETSAAAGSDKPKGAK